MTIIELQEWTKALREAGVIEFEGDAQGGGYCKVKLGPLPVTPSTTVPTPPPEPLEAGVDRSDCVCGAGFDERDGGSGQCYRCGRGDDAREEARKPAAAPTNAEGGA